jgi:hypothetical protein
MNLFKPSIAQRAKREGETVQCVLSISGPLPWPRAITPSAPLINQIGSMYKPQRMRYLNDTKSYKGLWPQHLCKNTQTQKTSSLQYEDASWDWTKLETHQAISLANTVIIRFPSDIGESWSRLFVAYIPSLTFKLLLQLLNMQTYNPPSGIVTKKKNDWLICIKKIYFFYLILLLANSTVKTVKTQIDCKRKYTLQSDFASVRYSYEPVISNVPGETPSSVL